MKKLFALLVLVFALSLFSFSVSAANIKIISPVEKTVTVQAEEVDLGVIGPGQTIEIVADRDSGVVATTSAKGTGIALWDSLVAIDLPSGWSAEPSKFYEQPLHAFVTASKTAPDGDYFVTVRAIDEYEGLGQQVFKAKIHISRNVLETSLFQSELTTGAGQPAVYFVRIANKGSASDAFDISLEGLPQQWVYVKKVYVPLKSELIVPYELVAGENGDYSFSFNTVSLSSSEIHSENQARLKVEASLLQDLRAVSRGALLFPSAEQVVYGLLGFVFSLN